MNGDPQFERIMSDFKGMQARWEAERRAARFSAPGRFAPRESRNRAIHDAAHIREPIGRSGHAELWICYSPVRAEALRLREHPIRELRLTTELLDPDALNGYVAYKKRSAPCLPHHDCGNLVQYIPVHGGVTYARKDGFAAVWGFDTLHDRSEEVERTDPDYIRYQCALLHHGLEVAAALWPKFRRERDQHKRAAMAQGLMEIDPARTGDAIQDRLGMLALLNLIRGKVG